MKPISISERLLFSTVRLVSSNGGSGTGFFFNFAFDDIDVPVIFTNMHVVNYNTQEVVTFFLHTTSNGIEPDEQSIQINFRPDWIFHTDKDLCFCFVNPLFQQIKQATKKDVFYSPLREENILMPDQSNILSAIEDVIMVGYPNGLWDEKNNLPLYRKGITASHPATNFNRENIGAVDMACFPGSSGSPIFILNEGGYSDKNGNFILAPRVLFLGILFEGPQQNIKGELVVENIPTHQTVSSITPVMINIGYYIKAIEILSFKEFVGNTLKQ
jgi:hypothetical protein